MSRCFIFLIALPFIISGCLVNEVFECSIIYNPYDAGEYTTRPIPDQYVALGDTLFLNVDEYWDYESECDKYAENPRLSSLIADSREVELHRQENSVFIVGQKTGTFTATVIGSAELVRDHKEYYEYIPMTFTVEVGTEPGSPLRQRARFPASGRIDSIRVEQVEMERKALWVIAEFSPEYSPESISGLRSRWAFFPTRNIDSLELMDISLEPVHEFGNDYYFNPDSLYQFYFVYVEVQPGPRRYGKTFIFNTESYFE